MVHTRSSDRGIALSSPPQIAFPMSTEAPVEIWTILPEITRWSSSSHVYGPFVPTPGVTVTVLRT